MSQLKTIPAAEFGLADHDRQIDSATLATARDIVEDVRLRGETAVRHYAEQFQERQPDQPLWIAADQLQAAVERIPVDQRELLERIAGRIETFAAAQRNCLSALTLEIPGGQAGHTIEPIQRVGCYAPAGRYPLPSTALMTAVTARVAGCPDVTLAIPRPNDLMLAAAAIAGADRVLAAGGAHAIAALAYGCGKHPPCDLIVGPGSRWVTAAKRIVSGDVGIDMLAGPSEMVAVADASADPERLAADLLAQAEHDTDARVFLVTPEPSLIPRVNDALARQLDILPTAENARVAVAEGAAILTPALYPHADHPELSAVEITNRLAPEHLELHCEDAQRLANEIRHAGCLFIGHESAEVFGDYGAGPNHTLPTAGTARWSAGLNVFTFLRVRTWLKLDHPPAELIADTARLAELEGLIAHQRAALHRQ